MKNLILSITYLLIFVASVLGTNLSSTDTSKVDAAGKKQGLWKEIMNGLEWYGNYYNDQKNGAWINYHTGIQPLMINRLESYINGKKNGTSLEIDRTGNISRQEYYTNDTIDGVAVIFANGGHAKSETTYRNGKLNGTKKLFNQENFKIQEDGMFIDNQRDGVTKWFYNEGTVSILYTYKKGMLEGKMKTFFRNGNLTSEGTYINNELEGDYYEYYEDGKPRYNGKYVKGKKEGLWKEYDELGKIKQVKYTGDNKL